VLLARSFSPHQTNQKHNNPYSALRALVLNDNGLMALPESVAALTALRVLCVAGNRLWQVRARVCTHRP
jgi:hypothetical protein